MVGVIKEGFQEQVIAEQKLAQTWLFALKSHRVWGLGALPFTPPACEALI